MKELKVYLSGTYSATNWRKEFASWIKNYNDLFYDCKLTIYDPTDYFKNEGNSKQVKNFYLNHLIKNSDVVLVNLSHSLNSIETAQELQYCVDHNIPIIGFGGTYVSKWLYEDCDVVFDFLNEAIEYIVDYFTK